jgi:hypothetical protein
MRETATWPARPSRSIDRLDLVLFLDVLSLNSGRAGLPDEFNVLTGQTINEDEETLPLFELTFEYFW